MPLPAESNVPRTRRGDWQTIRMLLPYLWGYRGRIGAALACLVLAKVANVGVPVLMKKIVDNLDPRIAVLSVPLALHQGGHVGRVRDRPRDDGVVAVWRRRVVALRLAPPLEKTAAASSCVVAPALEILMYVRVHSGFSRPRA